MLLGCIPPASAQALASAGRSPWWAPTAPPRAAYTIDYHVDTTQSVLEGTETIRLKHESSRPLTCIALSWRGDLCGDVVAESKGSPLVGVGAPQRDGRLTYAVLDLPSPLHRGQQLELSVRFRASVPKGILCQELLTLTDWHPRLYWTFPTHDDFAVKVVAPTDYVVVTTGRRDRSGYWRAERVRSFGIILGRGRRLRTLSVDGIAIECLFAPAAEASANVVLTAAADAVRFYRQRFGFYPYRTLALLLHPGRPGNGGPVATNVVVIHVRERLEQAACDRVRWITAHEVAHQYWSECVMARGVPNWFEENSLDPLMVGLGLYADQQYALARDLQWEHSVFFDSYTEALRAGKTTTVAVPAEELEARMLSDPGLQNNGIMHGKGFAIISALAEVLGQDAFEHVYRRCLQSYGGHRMGYHDLEAECERETGADLSWFFDQWVWSDRFPPYEIASQSCQQRDGGYLSHVEVRRLGTMLLPATVAAEFTDGTRQVKVADRLLDVEVLQFASAASLTRAVVDPAQRLALVAAPLPARTRPLAVRIAELPRTGSGEEARELLPEAEKVGLQSTGGWVKLGMCLYDGGHYEESLAAFGTLTRPPGASQVEQFISWVWQGHLLDLLGRRTEAIAAYQEALTNGFAEAVNHDQYGLSIDRQWVEERLTTPFVRPN